MVNEMRSCADKLVFDTRKQAEASATTLKWQRGVRLKAYMCTECELWHLSSEYS